LPPFSLNESLFGASEGLFVYVIYCIHPHPPLEAGGAGVDAFGLVSCAASSDLPLPSKQIHASRRPLKKPAIFGGENSPALAVAANSSNSASKGDFCF